MHQMLSLFEYLQCSSMCSPYVTICFYLICIVYPNLFNYSYVHIVCSQTDRVGKWQDQGCVIIDLTDLSMRNGTGVKLTEEWGKSEVGQVFWGCIVYKKLYFCVYVYDCSISVWCNWVLLVKEGKKKELILWISWSCKIFKVLFEVCM